MQKIQIGFLTREDPLEKEILASEIPWLEEPGRLQAKESEKT